MTTRFQLSLKPKLMNTSPPQDQRCDSRVTLTRVAKLKNSQGEYDVKIVDISTCGIGVLSNQKIMDENLSIHFSLPGYEQDNSISLPVQVKHLTDMKDKHLIGLAFTQASQHDLLVIKEFFNFHNRFRA